MTVKLEYGYYGGCSQHLGAYSYRGFDIVISSEYGDTPVEGLTFTLGLYEEGCDEAYDLFDIEGFSMERAINEVDNHIDMLFENGYKDPDEQIRQMRMLLKQTHDQEQRYLIEAAIQERRIELASISKVNMNAIQEGQDAFMSKKKSCTCGAKHTSNPNFHATWCDNK